MVDPVTAVSAAVSAAIVFRPGEDVEARRYYADGIGVFDSANSLVINTAETLELANNSLSFISRLKKAMESKKKKKLEPSKLETESIRDTYNYLMIPILEADKIIRGKMVAYDTEQRRIRAEAAEINRLRLEAANREAALTSDPVVPPPIVEVIPAPAKSVSTDMGSSGMVDHWKHEIIDIDLLPREYMVPDTTMLNMVARGHHDKKKVPGVRFYNEPYVASRTK